MCAILFCLFGSTQTLASQLDRSTPLISTPQLITPWFKHLTAPPRTANLVLVKSEDLSGWPKSWFGDFFFLLFSLKAHNYYPAYHIGPDFSNWKVPALWNSLHKKGFIMWLMLYFCCAKASAYFDRPGYWMSAIFPAKLWKTAES